MRTNLEHSCASFLYVALLVSFSFSMTAGAQPAGWFKAGTHPEDYDTGIEHARSVSGGFSGYIRNNKPNPAEFGTYMQMFDASDYRGSRIRLSAYVKSENVEKWAGIWMRVDRERKVVAFDNMQDRPIKGTNDWTAHAIVLDVDSNASAIAFGILLAGAGRVWIDEVKFEVVSKDVPVTGFPTTSARAPRNLDFEDGPTPR